MASSTNISKQRDLRGRHFRQAHLQDACYLALSFLSGARDSEIKHLCRGGLAIESDADGKAYRWRMNSLAFKGENNPPGVPATWNIG